jgi:hypothetical protein
VHLYCWWEKNVLFKIKTFSSLWCTFIYLFVEHVPIYLAYSDVDPPLDSFRLIGRICVWRPGPGGVRAPICLGATPKTNSCNSQGERNSGKHGFALIRASYIGCLENVLHHCLLKHYANRQSRNQTKRLHCMCILLVLCSDEAFVALPLVAFSAHNIVLTSGRLFRLQMRVWLMLIIHSYLRLHHSWTPRERFTDLLPVWFFTDAF